MIDIFGPVLFTCSLAASDVALTRSVMNQGGRELNPLLDQSLSRQVVIKASLCLAQGVILSKLPKKKRKLGYVIVGSLGTGLIVNGLIQGRK